MVILSFAVNVRGLEELPSLQLMNWKLSFSGTAVKVT
jgi:hypothetical protein